MDKVIQDDRDVAWRIVKAYRPNDRLWLSRIDTGVADGGELVQLVAAHRRQAEEAMRERCAKVADDATNAWLNAPAQTQYGQAYQAGCNDTAAAIRSMEVE